MARIRKRTVLIALLAALALVAAACGGGDNEEGGGGGTTTPTGGKTLVLGAEQEPECADWVASCAGSSWGVWVMEEHTVPRVFDYQKVNGVWTNVPSPLMAEAPTVADVNGKQTVTYKINPAAVWSDGVPITSSDFKYTWEQIANGKDIYDKTGYNQIESIDDSDPKTAVVIFSTPYGSWPALFGGGLYGILPSHILEGKSRAKAMQNGYSWSGGPWIADWDRGRQVTLTPNPNYWGTKPKLKKVIFRFIPNTAAQFKAFRSGEVLGIYPQPQPDVVEAIDKGLEGAQTDFTADTGNAEGLWLNNAKPPFDDLAVRQAFAYSIDRAAIVKRLFGSIGVTKPMQTFNPPIQAEYADRQAFSQYTQDLDQVNQLMTGAGWTKNDDGVWAKSGKAIRITINTTADNKRRELTEQILQEQLKAAGFDLRIRNKSAADLFGKMLPAGNYQVGLYAQVATSLEPGLCTIFCSKNIPGPANDNSGQNWQRVNVPEMDPYLETVDTSFDKAQRIAASQKADQLQAANMVSLPLDPLPNIAIWSDRIEGPLSDNPLFALFWNLNEWDLKG